MHRENKILVFILVTFLFTFFLLKYMCSRLLAGSEALVNILKKAADAQNISFFDAAKSAGYELSFDDLSNLILDEGSYSSVVELHIEQGPLLEEEGKCFISAPKISKCIMYSLPLHLKLVYKRYQTMHIISKFLQGRPKYHPSSFTNYVENLEKKRGISETIFTFSGKLSCNSCSFILLKNFTYVHMFTGQPENCLISYILEK
jgi:hypothetical protein